MSVCVVGVSLERVQSFGWVKVKVKSSAIADSVAQHTSATARRNETKLSSDFPSTEHWIVTVDTEWTQWAVNSSLVHLTCRKCCATHLNNASYMPASNFNCTFFPGCLLSEWLAVEGAGWVVGVSAHGEWTSVP